MRATDLIGCVVRDSDGVHLGHVHDLRFESAGKPGGAWHCRLTGFSCGRTSVGHRLGYGTGDMAGPWPISALFTRWKARRLEIDWSDVANFERPTVALRVTREQLVGGER
jgi:PRC-barrel domain protein